MTLLLTLELDSRHVLEALDRLVHALGPAGMAPAMKEIGEELAESTKRRFATSTAPDGARWAPNAEATYLSYIEARAGNTRKDGRLNAKGSAQAMNKRPLVDSGLLQDGIVYQLMAGGAGVEIGSNRFAGEWDGGAAVHQFGNKKGTIPARPFLGLSADDETAVLEIIEGYLSGEFGA